MSNKVFQQNLDDKKGSQPGGPYLIQMLFKEPVEMPDKEKMTAIMTSWSYLRCHSTLSASALTCVVEVAEQMTKYSVSSVRRSTCRTSMPCAFFSISASQIAFTVSCAVKFINSFSWRAPRLYPVGEPQIVSAAAVFLSLWITPRDLPCRRLRRRSHRRSRRPNSLRRSRRPNSPNHPHNSSRRRCRPRRPHPRRR